MSFHPLIFSLAYLAHEFTALSLSLSPVLLTSPKHAVTVFDVNNTTAANRKFVMSGHIIALLPAVPTWTESQFPATVSFFPHSLFAAAAATGSFFGSGSVRQLRVGLHEIGVPSLSLSAASSIL